jgi:hypothetical protein
MFPVNARMWADASYRADAQALLELCAERDVGVMAIKAAAKRPWDDGDRFATTWYEPLTETPDISRGVAFTLSVPGVHGFCTPGDLNVLRASLAAAENLAPMDVQTREECIRDAAAMPSIFPMPVG